MRIRISLISLCIVLFYGSVFAQRGDGTGGVVSGNLVDSDLKTPMEYANVVLYRSSDSTQAAGTASNSRGQFEILKVRPGKYYIRVYYMGYEIKQVGNIVLRPPNMRIDLGSISMTRTAVMAEAVEVTAGRLPITYQVDKKVINVSEYQTAVSGNAVDILEKVPSVNVDVDGNVSLRGSTNFTVLIDGRPSVLDASEALQQIPASSIENIEIITNPSARYNPAGTTGIVNIVLKKNRQEGRSGMANLNLSATDRYGGDVVIEQKDGLYAATLAVDYNKQFVDGTEEELFRTTNNGETSTIESDGDALRKRTNYGVRAGLDLFPTDKDQISVGGRFGAGDFGRKSSLNYLETSGLSTASYISANDRGRRGQFYSGNVSYRHLFHPKNHQINLDFIYSRRSGDEETVNELLTTSESVTSGRKSLEKGPNIDFRAKVDYMFGPESSRLETGYQYDLDASEDKTSLLDYDTLSFAYGIDPAYNHSTRYDRGIHALYGMYSIKAGPLTVQTGLRTEHTDQDVEFDDTVSFVHKRWDFYPTIHTTYEITPTLQGMASYARRTERPRAWYLEPFETWMDAYNVRVGNPALKQEFIDSYEGGLQKNFGRYMLSTEMYYRITHNKVERVRSVYDENVTLHSIENIGRDYALGGEGLFTAEFTKDLSTNLTANMYQYRVEGRLFGESFSRSSFNWNLRMNNTFRPNKRTMIQVDGQYESPTTSSQGRREGFFSINAAVRYEIIPRQLTATLQVRDMFGTVKYEDVSEGPDFYNYRYSVREAPIIMLNLRYTFNNFKSERERRGRGDGGGDDDDF